MPKLQKIRLDQLLVDRGLIDTVSKARARVLVGDVIVLDQRVDKPGLKFLPNVDLRLRGNSHPFVSRGGVKLEHALKLWPGSIHDAICMDVGASTGGFTEVLLKHGAKKVYAIDVGYGQLADQLRKSSRVQNMERTHILHVKDSDLIERPAVASIDVSFISLSKVLPHVASLLAPCAHIYALIKPQFEAGREHVEKGGLVKDPQIHEMCIKNIKNSAESLGFKILGVEQSPITGAKGNIEFLIALVRE